MVSHVRHGGLYGLSLRVMRDSVLGLKVLLSKVLLRKVLLREVLRMDEVGRWESERSASRDYGARLVLGPATDDAVSTARPLRGGIMVDRGAGEVQVRGRGAT